MWTKWQNIFLSCILPAYDGLVRLSLLPPNGRALANKPKDGEDFWDAQRGTLRTTEREREGEIVSQEILAVSFSLSCETTKLKSYNSQLHSRIDSFRLKPATLSKQRIEVSLAPHHPGKVIISTTREQNRSTADDFLLSSQNNGNERWEFLALGFVGVLTKLRCSPGRDQWENWRLLLVY